MTDRKTTAIIYRNKVHVEQHDGIVKVVRSWDGEVLLGMTLAAAEDLADGIERHARFGRLEAKQNGSEAHPDV